MSIIKISNQFIDQETGVSGFVSEEGIVYLNLKGKFVLQEDFELSSHIYGFAMSSPESINRVVDVYDSAKEFFRDKTKDVIKKTTTKVISDTIEVKINDEKESDMADNTKETIEQPKSNRRRRSPNKK